MEDSKYFDEAQWMRILFLISDTDKWLRQTEANHFYQLPLKHHKKLLRKSWYLSAAALAHIIERHYYKIARHPSTGKFTIDISSIAAYVRDAFHQEAFAVPQSCNVQRVLDTESVIGYDGSGNSVTVITVISDNSGNIITAFPGTIANSSFQNIAP